MLIQQMMWFSKMKSEAIERVYIPIWDWEEISHNMWGTVENRDKFLRKAIAFTSDHKVYGRFMIRVIREWPKSCENALTDMTINRKAWIGHAACALAFGCPEDIVREAWGYLTDEQQFLANNKARIAIQKWERAYLESKGIRKGLGGSLL